MATHEETNKYAYLDQLSTSELKKILRADAESPESGDVEAIFYILEVIERREREHPTGSRPDIEQSWRDFQTVYNTPEGKGRSLYPCGLPEAAPAAKASSKTGVKRRPLLVAAAAAVLVVILAVPVAGRDNLIETIGKWASEQFSFFSADSRENEGRIPLAESFDEESSFGEELREVLLEYGITEEVVPRWAPDGFALNGNVIVQEYPGTKNIDFFALYKNGTESILIDIMKYEESSSDLIYEKIPDEPEIYIANDIPHYILENNLSSTVVWYIGELECSVSTTLSDKKLEQIIDSIYE